MKTNYQRFGVTKKKWDAYKKEAREILVSVARCGDTITYGGLAARMTSIQVEPHDMILWHIIGDVAADEEAAKRGLLSAVVVHKHGDMEPGFGFYELAKYFGRNTQNKTTCFIDELHAVHAIWSIPSPAPKKQSRATKN